MVAKVHAVQSAELTCHHSDILRRRGIHAVSLCGHSEDPLEDQLSEASRQASNNHRAGPENAETGHDLVDSRVDERMEDTKASVSPRRVDGVWVAVTDQCQRQSNGVLSGPLNTACKWTRMMVTYKDRWLLMKMVVVLGLPTDMWWNLGLDFTTFSITPPLTA